MKGFILSAALAGLAIAAPLDSRGSMLDPTTVNDIEDGNCANAKVALVWARASTENGNLGDGASVGPKMCAGLKQKYGATAVACQGVDRDVYKATLADNVGSLGTTEAAISQALTTLENAASKCSDAVLLAGGYSQGTAVMMNAVSSASADLKNRIKGVTLYGYTKNKQTNGGIPGYPQDNLQVYCASNDGVCKGTLLVTGGHFAYLTNGDIDKGMSFYEQKISEAQSSGSSSSSGMDSGMSGMSGTSTESSGMGSTGSSTESSGMSGMSGMDSMSSDSSDESGVDA